MRRVGAARGGLRLLPLLRFGRRGGMRPSGGSITSDVRRLAFFCVFSLCQIALS